MQSDEAKTIVLIVEDETLVRMEGTDILEEAGFQVLEASTADEALSLLAQHDDVRLLFSDIDMPGSMDGLDLARIVHQRWPKIRLLLTSGHYRLSHAVLPDKGRFVRKPWADDALVQKIRTMLLP